MNKCKMLAILFVLFFLLSSTQSYGLTNKDNNDQSEDFEDIYGFILSVNKEQNNIVQMNIIRTVNYLLHKSVKVYRTKTNITLTTKLLNETSDASTNFFERGSFIIPFTDNNFDNQNITKAVYRNNVKEYDYIYKITSPNHVLDLKELFEPRIVCYKSDVVVTSANYYLNNLEFGDLTYINNVDISNNNLTRENFDILIMGGQGASDIDTLKELISPEWREAKNGIKNFVKNGGNYIGICHGSARTSFGIKKPLSLPNDYKYTRLFNMLGFYLKIVDCKIYRALPGSGMLNVEFSDMNHPITFGCPKVLENHFYGKGPMFLKKIGSDTKALGLIKDINAEHWDYDGYMDDSIWYNSDKVPDDLKDKFINRWIEYSKGKPIWVEQEYGKGKVFAFGGHPETSYNLYETDYRYGLFPSRVLSNTIFYICSEEVENINIDNKLTFSDVDFEISGPTKIKGGYFDPYEVNFSANVTSDEKYNYYWFSNYQYFNEGNKKYSINSFKELGDFRIGLCLITEQGTACVKDIDIKVVESLQLKANLTPYKLYKGYTNEQISFSIDVKNGIDPIYYFWNFGDGESSNEKNPKHIYLKPGYYKVKIKVKDKINDADWFHFYYLINDRNPSFTYNVDVTPSIIIEKNFLDINVYINLSKNGVYDYNIYINDYLKGNFSNIEGKEFLFSFKDYFYSDFDLVIEVVNEYNESFYFYKEIDVRTKPFISFYVRPINTIVNKVNTFEFHVSEDDIEDVDLIVNFGNGYIDYNKETFIKKDEHIYDTNGKYIIFYYNYTYDRPGNYTILCQATDEIGLTTDMKIIGYVNVRKPTLVEWLINIIEKINFIDLYN